MRSVLLLTGLLLATTAVAHSAIGVRATPDESWVGSQYGWSAKPPPRCKPRADVCSTEDGGAIWRGIFDGGTFIFGIVRTSRTTGAVSTGRTASARFWTRDNGRHWYRTARIGVEFQGSGPYLFWIDFGPTLRQMKPWPPRRKAVCKGEWTGGAFETIAEKGGNVCSGPAVEAGMRAVPVVRLEEGTLATLANVPGGVIAGVTASPVPRVVLFRLGQPRVIDLPMSGDLMPCTGSGAQPFVAWPRISVLGCRKGIGAAGMWLSDNGGATWRVIAK